MMNLPSVDRPSAGVVEFAFVFLYLPSTARYTTDVKLLHKSLSKMSTHDEIQRECKTERDRERQRERGRERKGEGETVCKRDNERKREK